MWLRARELKEALTCLGLKELKTYKACTSRDGRTYSKLVLPYAFHSFIPQSFISHSMCQAVPGTAHTLINKSVWFLPIWGS